MRARQVSPVNSRFVSIFPEADVTFLSLTAARLLIVCALLNGLLTAGQS